MRCPFLLRSKGSNAMAFIPVNNAAKAALKFTAFGQQLVNTLWFIKDGGWTESDLTDLCTALNSWVVGEYAPLMSNDCSYIGSTAVDMSAEGQEGVEVNLSTPEEGGNVVAGLPLNVTAAVKFLTGFTGRSNRGRNYFVGLGENQVTGNTLESAAITAIQGAYDALGSYLLDMGATHVVASLFSGVDSEGKPIPRSAGVTRSVTSYAMDQFADSMRRRLTGRGT